MKTLQHWTVLLGVLLGFSIQAQTTASDKVKITGLARYPDGQPAAGLEVRIVGDYSSADARNVTDSQGRFDLEWNKRAYRSDESIACLLIRDAKRNLAVAQDFDEDSGLLDLRLAPGLTLVGRAECDGKPVTNATAALVFFTGNSGMHLNGLCVETNQPGHFEIPALPPGRRYGLYVLAPGYGQKYINEVDSADPKRVEVDPVELKLANLKLAGKVLDADDKPVIGANVHLYGEGQPSANTRTDREGQFSFAQVCEGTVVLSANARNSHGNISAEAGDTNVVLKLGEAISSGPSSRQQKLKGTVTGPDGKPVAGAQVAVFPMGASRWIKTGPDGSFNLTWTIESWRAQSENSSLVVRDPDHNLAAAEELSEESTNLTVQLKPALTLTGRVEGPDGQPLPKAQIGVWLRTANSFSQVDPQLATPDARGAFQITNLPVGPDYTVYAQAQGHGRSQQQVKTDTETKVELEPFVLRLADRVLSGQVVNADEKPVSGVQISLSGDDQPQESATSDKNGRFTFKVCEGSVRLFASSQNGYGNTSAEAGDTNVVLQLRGSGSSIRPVATRSSLRGKPLPDLAALGLAADAVPTGQPVLLCLVDVEQRPSRRMARLLSEQHAALKQRGLSVLAIQAAVTSADSLKEWKGSNPVPFPVGCVVEKSEKTKWATGIESFPWLILTDAKGRVTAEGFPLEELETKLQGLSK